jgi:hypothetical protein
MTDQELKDLVASLVAKELKTIADKEKADGIKDYAEIRKTMKELSQNIGGIGNSNGAYAEEFFYNALKKSKKMGGVKFDAINKNVSFSKKGIHDEFDLVLINGNSVGLIETKYKATTEHLQKLINKKPASFKILFPEFKDYKFYLGLAAMSFESKEVEDEAHKAGVAILKQKGKSIEKDDKNLKIY